MATITSDSELSRLKYVGGPQNLPVPTPIRPSRGAVSHQWRGPGFYKSETRRFAEPAEVGPDPVAQGLDKTAAMSMPHFAEYQPNLHGPSPFAEPWRGRPVFFSADHRTLSNEHPASTVPADARLFYNEDDWEKYKFMLGNGDIQRQSGQQASATPDGDGAEQVAKQPRGNRPKERVWYF